MNTNDRFTPQERRFFWGIVLHVVMMAVLFFGFMHGVAWVLEHTRGLAR